LTAVAVDPAGRVLEERTLACGEPSLLAWAARLGEERLWALEDCRHVTAALERMLLGAGPQVADPPTNGPRSPWPLRASHVDFTGK
jgi:transposase